MNYLFTEYNENLAGNLNHLKNNKFNKTLRKVSFSLNFK